MSCCSVEAGVDMHTGLITDVTLMDQNVPESNVTGLPAFNGYVVQRVCLRVWICGNRLIEWG